MLVQLLTKLLLGRLLSHVTPTTPLTWVFIVLIHSSQYLFLMNNQLNGHISAGVYLRSGGEMMKSIQSCLSRVHQVSVIQSLVRNPILLFIV